MCSSSPTAPIPHFGAAAPTAATGPGKATFAGLASSLCQSTGGADDDDAAAAAVAGVASGDAGKGAFLASTTARCQPGAKRALSESERLGLTGKISSGIEGDEDVSAVSPARKRRRHCSDEESGGGDKPEVSSTELSDKLVLPFSKYCVAGTPNIVAPELARAWREEKDLDFRRSDVSL